ncbi:MAG TPA: phosphoribosyltransferase family protein, partial [Halomonas sp.]|nr:phosphoribosyltransferase family protein [Halomonas sp.]
IVSGDLFAGDVAGRAVWIVDDMIVGGGTMLRAAQACRARGAAEVHLAAAHALLSEEAIQSLADPAITSVTLTNSAADTKAAKTALGNRLHVLSTGPVIAEAIQRLHST